MPTVQKPRRQLNADFELLGYDTICEMLAVDGKAPSSCMATRHLRRHRDIVKPVRLRLTRRLSSGADSQIHFATQRKKHEKRDVPLAPLG